MGEHLALLALLDTTVILKAIPNTELAYEYFANLGMRSISGVIVDLGLFDCDITDANARKFPFLGYPYAYPLKTGKLDITIIAIDTFEYVSLFRKTKAGASD